MKKIVICLILVFFLPGFLYAAKINNKLLPQSQIQFENVISETAKEYEKALKASNDIQKALARENRTKKLIELQMNSAINDWVGIVDSIGTNGDGHGHVIIKINNDISLWTMNTAFADTKYNTLIHKDSDLFKVLVSLSKGDKVKFSGTLFEDDETVYYMLNLTKSGAMRSPDFLIRFTDITPIK